MIHVLPDGFHRIRYYGFLGNCHRARKLELCGNCSGWHQLHRPSHLPSTATVTTALTGSALHQCPHCRTGMMVVIGCIARPGICQSIPDTS